MVIDLGNDVAPFQPRPFAGRIRLDVFHYKAAIAITDG
jgi:hypothetical protein